jgi:hypothetical protein
MIAAFCSCNSAMFVSSAMAGEEMDLLHGELINETATGLTCLSVLFFCLLIFRGRKLSTLQG